jgi:SpoIID/LytB domain protein
MEVRERSLSGRVLKMHVQTDKGEVILEKNEARSAFAPPLSTLFYVEPVYEEPEKQAIDLEKQIESESIIIPNPELKGFNFIGGGFGHGVGMSQYGSYNLGKLGWLPEQILHFYYPGTTIKPLDSSIVFYPED